MPASHGGLCSLLDGPLQVIKEQIVREVEGSVGASVTVDSWSEKCVKDSFIAATIHYRPNRHLRDATSQKPTDEELLETWTRDRLADDLWQQHHQPERTSRVEDETLDVLAQPIYISDSEPDEDGSTRGRPNRHLRDATSQKPTDEELLETWTRDRLADDLWQQHHQPERTSRVEDETLDVLAQPIYISDSEPDEDGSTRDNPCDDSFYLRRFCITKSAFLVLLILLAFFSVCSLVLLSYISHDLMRKGKKIADRDASYTYTTSSSFSSTSDDHPSNIGALISFRALRQTPQMHFGCSYSLPR
ncbi:hypothetical protein Tcan_06285 [Toxocara canis]|uniref:Uncharacterized protein n=1 Tax=Toxocara canis TaxID=6265 RepID=A0A0B2URC7_TOXCA|nr:hypothetical protein Tcan_06285 [Toxocara canis]